MGKVKFLIAVYALFALAAFALPFQALFNHKIGLAHWNRQLQSTLLTANGLTSYSQIPPLNVVMIGHSIEEGVMDLTPGDQADWYPWRYPNLLRRDLRQFIYSRVSRTVPGPVPQGGSGFIPAVDSAGTPIIAGPGSWYGGQQTGSWTDHRWNTDRASGIARRYTESTVPESTSRFYRYSNFERQGTDQPTSLRVVYQQIPNGGQMEIAVTDWFGVEVFESHVVSCESADGLPHYGLLSPSLNLNHPGGDWVRIRNISTGNQPIRWEGVDWRSGDESWGLQVHSFACGGTTAEAYAIDANIEALERYNPDVIIIWLDFNDVYGPVAPGVVAWRENLELILQKIRSRMRNVSILLKLGFDYVGGPWPTMELMQTQIEELAIQYRAAVLSHHVYALREWVESYAVPRGIKEPWVVHFNRQGGQPFESNLTRSALLWSIIGSR